MITAAVVLIKQSFKRQINVILVLRVVRASAC